MIAMEVPLEVVPEQMGHASIRVTKDVYGHLMPKARAKAAEAMRSVLFDEIIPVRPHASVGLATQVATSDVANSSEIIPVRPHASVGLATQVATSDVANSYTEP